MVPDPATQSLSVITAIALSQILGAGTALDSPWAALACAVTNCAVRERTGDGRKRAIANGVKFGRKPKLSEHQRKEALKRRAAGETLTEIAKSYRVDVSMISRLS